ncbi:unnamed protein product [Durusdinium trenchii]|uniref:Uncharacterized protein n=1 Tax=Durusdinium trenchii TaxID=1381693 RepID=A0ABP0I4J1_9DINO
MLIGPCAEAIGASLCWAVGLTLLARPRHPGDHTDHAEGLGAPEGTSRLSFYGGALVFVVGYAFSVSSALSPTPSRNLAMAALSASFPFSLLAQAWLFRWPSATEAGSYLLSFLGMECMKLMQACMQFRARHCFEHLWQTECVCVCVCVFAWKVAVAGHYQMSVGRFWLLTGSSLPHDICGRIRGKKASKWILLG